MRLIFSFCLLFSSTAFSLPLSYLELQGHWKGSCEIPYDSIAQEEFIDTSKAGFILFGHSGADSWTQELDHVYQYGPYSNGQYRYEQWSVNENGNLVYTVKDHDIAGREVKSVEQYDLLAMNDLRIRRFIVRSNDQIDFSGDCNLSRIR